MTSQPQDGQELARLIEAVWIAAPAMKRAAARLEQAQLEQAQQEQPVIARSADGAPEDLAVVDRWLSDLARIAVIVCDQPHPLSKELGARLEAASTSLGAHLKPA